MGLLVSAANGGHVEVVRLVLERQGAAVIEDTDEGGYTPLLLAAQRGHVDVVQFLVAHGANLHARTRRHHNDALALAAELPEMLSYLTYAWQFSPLHAACDARMVDAVHAALSAGADPAVGEPSPLSLCLAQGTYQTAKPPCPETTTLLRMALLPWAPETHLLFGSNTRAAIMHVFSLRAMLGREDVLPHLPLELWLHIASFIPRETETPALPAASLAAAPRRREWRKRRLGCAPAEEPEAMVVEDDEGERPEQPSSDAVVPRPTEVKGDDPASAVAYRITWV